MLRKESIYCLYWMVTFLRACPPCMSTYTYIYAVYILYVVAECWLLMLGVIVVIGCVVGSVDIQRVAFPVDLLNGASDY